MISLCKFLLCCIDTLLRRICKHFVFDEKVFELFLKLQCTQFGKIWNYVYIYLQSVILNFEEQSVNTSGNFQSYQCAAVRTQGSSPLVEGSIQMLKLWYICKLDINARLRAPLDLLWQFVDFVSKMKCTVALSHESFISASVLQSIPLFLSAFSSLCETEVVLFEHKHSCGLWLMLRVEGDDVWMVCFVFVGVFFYSHYLEAMHVRYLNPSLFPGFIKTKYF